MATTIGEFALSLVVDAGKGELTIGNLVASMGELEVASVGEIAILVELAKALVAITEATMKTSLGLALYAHQTGASSQALEEWQSAARHTQTSAADVASTFLNVSKALEDIKMGKSNELINAISFLHISLRGLDASHPERFLERVHAAILKTKLSADQFLALRSSGLGQMLEVMQMPMAKFDAAKKESGTTSEREKSKYQEIFDQMATIENISIRIKRLISDWFSDSTVAGFKEIAHILEVEYESLKTIQEYMQSDNSGKTTSQKIKALGSEAANESILELGKLIRGAPLGAAEIQNWAPWQPIAPIPYRSSATPEHQKTEVHVSSTNHFHRSNMSQREITDAIYEGNLALIQRAVTQLDNGVLA